MVSKKERLVSEREKVKERLLSEREKVKGLGVKRVLEREKVSERVSEEEYQVLAGKYRELEDLVNDLKKGFKSLERFQRFYELLLKKVDWIVKRKLEEESKKIVQENKGLKGKVEELRKENKILRERMTQERKEWKGANEELRKENVRLKEATVQDSKKWSVRQEELEKENVFLKEVAEKYRSCLTERFLRLQETLWEMDEGDREYEEFFNDAVLPLQILIGLANGMDGLTEEKTEYYIWDVIVEPLVGVLKRREGNIQNGKLVLPEPLGAFEKERLEKKVAQESLDKIEQYIKEDERRAELKEIVLQKRHMVEDLGRMMEELKELAKTRQIRQKEIGRLAKEVRFLFEKNGIYPMFAEDLRESSDSEFVRRMIPVKPNSIRYPGLFIKRNGGLEVFGMNIGMDDCEENTL